MELMITVHRIHRHVASEFKVPHKHTAMVTVILHTSIVALPVMMMHTDGDWGCNINAHITNVLMNMIVTRQ